MPLSRRAGLALVLLASTVSHAQSITLNFSGSTLTLLQYGPNDCTNPVPIVQFTASGLSSANVCGSLQLWVTNSAACADAPVTSSSDGGTADLVIGTFDLTTVSTGNANSFRVSDMPGVTSASGGCGGSIDVKNAVCASVQFRSAGVGSTCNALTASNLTVRYDNIPPDPPSINLLAQDSQIVVQFSSNNDPDVVYYQVWHAPVPANDSPPSFVFDGQVGSNSGSKPIMGLTNDQEYIVRAYSVDEVLNLSLTPAEATATPLASNGFWAEYKDAGGHEVGGCNATGAAVPSALSVLAVLVAMFRRRR